MDEKNKRLLKRVGAAVLGLFFIFYVSYQVYMVSFDSVKTVTAVEKTVNNSLFTKGYFIRDEEYVTNSASGTVVPVANDGDKVTGGNTVAIVFGSDSAAQEYDRIETLKSEIACYERLDAVSPSATNIDIGGLDRYIDNSITELVDKIISGELDTLSDEFASLRDSITKKQLMLGTSIDFKGIIDGLEAELKELEAVSYSSAKITAKETGYYINSVDGCERLFDFDKAEQMTPEQVETLINRTPSAVPPNCMGKLVKGFNWYIAAKIDIKDIADLKKGASVYIDFPYSSTGKLKAEVAAINVSDVDTAAVVFKCNTMSDELANMRIQDIEIIFGSLKGFRVPSEAVREVGGVKGIFILRSNTVTFRKINIVWSSDEYVITADAYEKIDGELKKVADDEIKLYDEIIVKGKNLYDGKAIN